MKIEKDRETDGNLNHRFTQIRKAGARPRRGMLGGMNTENGSWVLAHGSRCAKPRAARDTGHHGDRKERGLQQPAVPPPLSESYGGQAARGEPRRAGRGALQKGAECEQARLRRKPWTRVRDFAKGNGVSAKWRRMGLGENGGACSRRPSGEEAASWSAADGVDRMDQGPDKGRPVAWGAGIVGKSLSSANHWLEGPNGRASIGYNRLQSAAYGCIRLHTAAYGFFWCFFWPDQGM
ncbi:MAG: hypothetical protein JWR26_3351 [Pedosphaera sp.]|nr:hypothetical protein [Pedosphaera sp.]